MTNDRPCVIEVVVNKIAYFNIELKEMVRLFYSSLQGILNPSELFCIPDAKL